jgi:hypothetical protein
VRHLPCAGILLRGRYQQLFEFTDHAGVGSGTRIYNMIGDISREISVATTGITGLWQPSVHSDVAF